MDLPAALALLDGFATAPQLTQRISDLEDALVGASGASTAGFATSVGVNDRVLDAAVAVKRAAGQINVLIHALGILLALPHVLETNEVIRTVSLGAGNTGRPYDLETDRRVAEFKFIAWRGGAEAIRQNSVFVDLLHLLQDQSGRKRFLYVLHKEIPLRFLQGNRSITSVLSKNAAAANSFTGLYGDRYKRVSEWYRGEVHGKVEIVDLSRVLPSFTSQALTEAESTAVRSV